MVTSDNVDTSLCVTTYCGVAIAVIPANHVCILKCFLKHVSLSITL